MKTTILDAWESMRTSLWLIPALMAGLSIIFAVAMIRLDESFLLDYEGIRTFFYAGGSDGARLILSSIAGSMITVAGVTFSITMVALTQTVSQFGPSLLRNFMADRFNQIVLGAFIATFIYSLIVLRTIQDSGAEIFIPRVAISVSIALVLASFGLLIYFFHHVATSIHPDNVIDSVYHQLVTSINRFFPGEVDKQPTKEGERLETGLNFDNGVSRIRSTKSGYLRFLDEDSLHSLAREDDVVIKVHYRPGNFVFAGTPLISVSPGKDFDQDTEDIVRSAFFLGSSRTPEHDIEFSIHQFVEVALRALSPGINDPYTAISCIDRLGASLCAMNEKSFPTPYQFDDRGKLRLILNVVDYDGILDAAFNQIRQYGRGNVDINIRLLEILHVAAMTTRDKKRYAAIKRHGEMIYRSCGEAIPEKEDRKDVDERFKTLLSQLEG
ncbi:MAG: DUF2254 domain-containing protein [Desulfobulbaceae bacterium]|nr:DUF2254 domain-containing protein [Desulfobulbaceae bacterium]